MEEVNDRFIILKSVDVGEKNKKLSLFCEKLGKVFAIGRGVRSQKAKLKFLTLPFCVCDATLFKTGSIYLVKTAKVIHSFMALTQVQEKFDSGNIILETLLKFDNLNNIHFNKAISILEYIENVDKNEILFAFKFLIDLLYTNFNLNFSCCNICGNMKAQKLYLNFQTGELECENCIEKNVVQIKHSTVELLDKIANMDLEQIVLLNIENEIIKSIKLFLNKLIKGLIEIDLNTLKK